MFGRLFLLFIIVPLVDLFLLFWVAKHTGPIFTVCLVVTTAAIGAWLARQQGSAVRSRILQQFQNKEMPSDLLTDGAMIMLAAGLLLTPGLLTDCFGFTLLTPVCRGWYKKLAMKWLKKNFKIQVIQPNRRASSRHADDEDVIDGEVVRHGPTRVQPRNIVDETED